MKNLFLLMLVIGGFITSLHSQNENNKNMKTALLIIDIQEFYFPSEENTGLLGAEEASLVAKEVLEVFREQDQLVIHVRHQSDEGFAIHPNVKPFDSEKVITKTEINGFLKTDLLDYLQKNEVTRLVVIGMQTQMCLEAAVRAAHDYDFECVVIGDACTTRDLKFDNHLVKAEDVHSSTLATLTGGGYAKVISLDSFKKDVDKILFRE